MFVMDSQGAQYQVDEGLRQQADQLMRSPQFQRLISHVDLDQVVFLRLTGSKAKWHGKCMYIGKAPLTIIPKFVMSKLNHFGVLNLNNVRNVDENFFDLRFFIIINDDSISMASGNLQQVETTTLLHELMHIHPDGDKLVKHDIEDFKDIVSLFGPYWAEGIFQDKEGTPSEDKLPQIVSDFVPISDSEDWSGEES
jgi:hypothetical protein